MFIVELGSGNTCKNDPAVVLELIDGVVDADTGKYPLVFKMQLFKEVPPNVPLDLTVFEEAYHYAAEKGYGLTASVFDLGSLSYLVENFNVPFVKIACRNELYPLAAKVPRETPAVVSYPSTPEMRKNKHIIPLCCVPKYPAAIEEYERRFPADYLAAGISDHTTGFELFEKYQPEWYEKHIVLRRSKSNPDAGPFAATVKDLEGVL